MPFAIAFAPFPLGHSNPRRPVLLKLPVRPPCPFITFKELTVKQRIGLVCCWLKPSPKGQETSRTHEKVQKNR
jgi:hypothetical protein